MIFLDTSGLLCFQSVREPDHDEAVKRFGARGAKYTHSYVLAEYVALTHVRGLQRQAVLAFLENLSRHPEVAIVWVDSSLHAKAMRLLAGRLDKTYSLADAASFVLMRRHEIVEALTTDHHFEQEGFVRLLHTE